MKGSRNRTSPVIATEIDDDLVRYLTDRDDVSFARLVRRHRPLVVSVCRGLLRDPDGVEEAAQRTFIQFYRQADTITGSLTGWLARVARNACHDLDRERAAERRKRDGWARAAGRGDGDGDERYLLNQLVERLPGVLSTLRAEERALLIKRYVRRVPLRVLAHAEGVSIATMSRRVYRVLEKLADHASDCVWQALGEQLDDPSGTLDRALGSEYVRDIGLRVADDWHRTASGEWSPWETRHVTLSGWDRPLRVGFLLSQTSYLRSLHGTDQVVKQAKFTDGVGDLGIHLVSIFEGDSTGDPVLERAVRDYGVHDGLIEIADKTDLDHLDVIVLSHAFSLLPSVAERVLRAVRRGTGLLINHLFGNLSPELPDEVLSTLLLAQGPVGMHHEWMPTRLGCGRPRPAVVVARHPAVPGLVPGQAFEVGGCGRVYQPVRPARLIIRQREPVRPNAGMPALPIPVMVSGHIGRGRTLVFNTNQLEYWSERFGWLGDGFVENLIRWLAEPRRSAPAASP